MAFGSGTAYGSGGSNRPRYSGPRANRAITAPEVRVLSDSGEMLGVMSLAEALDRAESMDVDLVEVSANVAPPVCRLMRLSKYLYLSQKKKSSNAGAKKMKEIKMGVNISSRDLELKTKKAMEFLGDGHSLKIAIRMKGREMAHKEIADGLMGKIISSLSEVSRLNDVVQKSGNTFSAMLIPVSKKGKQDTASSDLKVAVPENHSGDAL